MLEKMMITHSPDPFLHTQTNLAARALRGFTLIELMVTITVLGILLAISLPSFNAYFDNYRAKRAAESLNAFLVNAKSEGVKRNQKINAVFKVSNSDATWCAGLIEGSAATCDCTAEPTTCTIDSVARTISSSEFKGVLLRDPDENEKVIFDPQRGTLATSGSENTIEVESARNQKIRVVVSAGGRINVCSPSGANYMKGYPTCP